MKTITCHNCQAVVAKLQSGSLVKTGAVMLCAECARPLKAEKHDSCDPVVEKLAKLFNMR